MYNSCSLRGNVERLAFSVLWEMDEIAHALNVRLTKSVKKCDPACLASLCLTLQQGTCKQTAS